MVGFLLLAWSMSQGQATRGATTFEGPAQAVKAEGPATPASTASSALTRSDKSSSAELQKKLSDSEPKAEDKLGPVNALAAVLAVILAVVTLVASKSATEAKDSVRLQVEALGRASEQARIAETAMLTAVLQGELIRLRELMDLNDPSLSAQVSKLSQWLVTLTQLMHGLARADQEWLSTALLPQARRLISMAGDMSMINLSPDVLTPRSRDLLHDAARVLSARLASAQLRPRNSTSGDLELLELLEKITLVLRRA